MTAPGAPAPTGVRSIRAPHHHARAVPCPHCKAAADRPCTTISGRHALAGTPVHDSRITAWARTTACCPVCQVEPGAPCHNGGWPLGSGVHPERVTEAERTPA